jgi:hypothetical protein
MRCRWCSGIPPLVVPALSRDPYTPVPCDLTISRHTPHMRGIQYAVASRFHFAFSGILDRPPSRAMTIEFADGSIIIWGFRLFKQHGNLMTDLIRHTPAFSRHEAPERCIMVSPLAKQRAQGKPGARRTRSLACEMNKAHEYRHHRFAEITRPSLRNGFNGFLRALPGDRALLPPSPGGAFHRT